ncbi:hypothetical protein BDV93DRAFT_563616 [Ceratobasidium sp. AG-I]|nr:hypothetical protein BDV93DRAFT_563616 [Ceratobasidium sp. AG-I]
MGFACANPATSSVRRFPSLYASLKHYLAAPSSHLTHCTFVIGSRSSAAPQLIALIHFSGILSVGTSHAYVHLATRRSICR